MNDLNRRVAKLEDSMGMKDPRYILTIYCGAGQEMRDLKQYEIEVAPGLFVYALAYGGPLTADEIADIRERHARRLTDPSDPEFDDK